MHKKKPTRAPRNNADKKQFMTIFVNGKQKRVPRPPLIDGLTVDEFIERNADPIWLHQNEMWELIEPMPILRPSPSPKRSTDETDAPF